MAGSYTAKMVQLGEETMELCIRENRIFFLTVNIHTVCMLWFSWHSQYNYTHTNLLCATGLYVIM